MIGIATAARTVGVLALAGAAALGMTMGPAVGVANATPGAPGPPSGVSEITSRGLRSD